MDRRDFLKTTGTIVAGATVAWVCQPPALIRCQPPRHGGTHGAAHQPQLALSAPRPRRQAHERDFDDSHFARVAVPHTNLRVPWHSFDEKSYEFVSIYRRRFRLPAAARGQRVFVDFEGVMTASTVWINGAAPGRVQGRLHALLV